MHSSLVVNFLQCFRSNSCFYCLFISIKQLYCLPFAFRASTTRLLAFAMVLNVTCVLNGNRVLNSNSHFKGLLSLTQVLSIAIVHIYTVLNSGTNMANHSNVISHFRVPKTLAFKMRLSAKPFLWKGVLIA